MIIMITRLISIESKPKKTPFVVVAGGDGVMVVVVLVLFLWSGWDFIFSSLRPIFMTDFG